MNHQIHQQLPQIPERALIKYLDFSYLFRLNEFELHSTTCPGNEVTVGWVVQ